jgi:hypothetical protein
MMSAWLILGAALGLAPPAPPQGSDELAPPVRLMANGKPINVEIGHAAPFYGDFDGTGKPTLLVGQFSEGKLRIYPNTGTAKEPKFDKLTWFMDGKPKGTVPTG